jgi:hypothetical protein
VKRLAKFLIVTALAASIGLHWALLQSVAWSSMLAANLRSASFAQAVQLTFDGKHPCCLCKAIAREKASEQKSDSQLSLKKLEFPPAAALAAREPAALFPVLTKGDLFARVRLLAPPTPPPRSCLA